MISVLVGSTGLGQTNPTSRVTSISKEKAMFLSRNGAKRWALLFFAVVLLVAVASKASAATTSVPIQPQFLSSPLSFNWNTTLTYRLKLVSSTEQPKTANLTFLPYVQLMPGAKGQNGKGGIDAYQRHYQLDAGRSRSFSFRLRTWDRPLNDVYWCLRVLVEVQGAAPQTIDTCAAPAHK